MTKVQKLDADGEVIKVGDYGYYHNEGYNFFATVASLSCRYSKDGIELLNEDGEDIGWIYSKDFHITERAESVKQTEKQVEAEKQKFTFAEIKEVWDAWHTSPAKHTFLEFFVKNTDPEYKEYLRLKVKFE